MEGSANIRPSIRMTNTMRESIRKSKTRATKGELKAAFSAALTKMSGNSAEQRLIRQIAAMMNRRQDIMAFISIGFGFRVFCLGFRLDSVNPVSLSLPLCLSVYCTLSQAYPLVLDSVDPPWSASHTHTSIHMCLIYVCVCTHTHAHTHMYVCITYIRISS